MPRAPAEPCTVTKYLDLLTHELVRYDAATSAREAKSKYGRVNIYRLGNLLQAADRVRAAVGGGSDEDKAAFRTALFQSFEPQFPPLKKVVKQLDAGTCKIK